ncbi:M16 family metallopeptidase [Candidatus Clostridium stratigraminis]|uniref:M16 family metallopeptidase n=1 Tax=Candidatus Clostridium stratigraminis TaxID=3381661 RepID=A0ABW8T772_9CLOT
MNKNIFDAKIHILENGLHLISIKKDSQLSSIHIGIKVGSINENSNDRGISHFIEHMLFKGTNNFNNEELNDYLEHRGGEYNAYTDYSCTVYSITALAEELEPSINILSDMIQYSIFPEKEIERERGVILAEIRTSKDDIEDFSFKRANEVAFTNSPLRYDTLGEEKTVKRFKKEQIVDYYNKYYCPNNAFITIVSPYDHEVIYNLVKTYFFSWQKRELKEDNVSLENNIEKKVVSLKKDIEQSTIVYVFTFHGLSKQEELALKILNHKFGESANSILFRELREEKGLAYDVYSQMDITNNVKTLYIYTAVSEDKIDEAINSIDASIKKIKTGEANFNENTVILMKKVLKTAVAATMEDCTDLGNYVLHQSMDNESIYEFLEDMENLEQIKSIDLYKVANKVFNSPTIHILKSEI